MSKPMIGPLLGQRLRLRLIEAGDLPLTLAWRNQDHIRRWFIHSDLLTLETHRAWFLKYLERDDDFLFLIEETDRLRKPIGQVGLYGINWRERTAEYGRILIGEPDARGERFAGEATTTLLAFAFREWGLREISLEVLSNNERAICVYRRCGFEFTSDKNGLVLMRVTPECLVLPTSPSVDRMVADGRNSIADLADCRSGERRMGRGVS